MRKNMELRRLLYNSLPYGVDVDNLALGIVAAGFSDLREIGDWLESHIPGWKPPGLWGELVQRHSAERARK